jgi:Ca-activated chloride channel family protein
MFLGAPVLRFALVSVALPVLCLGSAVASAQPVFRSGVDLVNLGVTVIDRKGTLVTNLGPDDFEVVEKGRRQRVELFVRGSDRGDARPPLHIGLLFDTSGSMAEDLSFAQSAAVKFLKTVDWAEDMTLVDFDTEVRVTTFGHADFPRLVERVRSRRSDGMTALYDAVGIYLDGASMVSGEKILVLYTDGGNNTSSMSYGDVLTALKASDVALYVIGFLEHQSASYRNELRLRLQQLAETAGGLAFFPVSVKQLDEMYEKIRQEIDARYLLGYTSSDPRQDGAWRPVEVRLTRPDLKGARVRTRKGYFAPYRAAESRP